MTCVSCGSVKPRAVWKRYETASRNAACKSESDLVARLGAPQHVNVLQDGSRILVYTQMETTQQGAPYQAPPARLTGGIYGGNSGVMYTPSASYSRPQGLASAEMVSCTIAFRILGDRIESWRSRGDNCVSN